MKSKIYQPSKSMFFKKCACSRADYWNGVAPGQTYQLWLTDAHGSISCRTFDVTSDGQTVVMIKAPAPIPLYDQVMVTVEPSGGATTPTGTIVLSGPLRAAQPVIVALFFAAFGGPAL